MRRYKWKSCAILLVLVNLTAIKFCSGQFQKQPKFVTQNGNLIFESAQDRNISFVMKGRGKVIVNDVDILSHEYSTSTVSSSTQLVSLNRLNERIGAIENRLGGPRGFINRLNNLERTEKNVSLHTSSDPREFSAIKQRTSSLENNVETILTGLRKNNCDSIPCQNGGTCINLYNSFACQCRPEWEGHTCSNDVNECAKFAGTDLGCQNGATCVNTVEGFICQCTNGFLGMHCGTKQNDCLLSSSKKLCGHGMCINIKNNNSITYKCICDPGWTTNHLLSPSCNVDIDECTNNQPHCSKSPLVTCINLPGSYMCGSCPSGYTGNGYYCADINECELNNGGCSVAPTVACINTIGSYRCGNCPSGYRGDGRFCTPSSTGSCPSAFCHSLAICTPTPLGASCSCPPGLSGTGYGPEGCIGQALTGCSSNPCLNGGTCTTNGNSYTCQCLEGFSGPNCTPNPRPCNPNPCQNGATCSVARNSNPAYVCTCQSGFGGLQCQTEIRSCGGVRVQNTGVIKFPPDGYVSLAGRKQCVWSIRVNATKSLNINFTRFEMDTGCQKDFLQIHDGKTTQAPLIGRYCGVNIPAQFFSTHNILYIWMRLESQNNSKGFTLNWEAVRPVCGGVIEQEKGKIESPGFPTSYPLNRDCTWTLQTRPGKRFSIQFHTLQLENHTDCDHDYLSVHSGSSIESQMTNKFCNTTDPPVITSATNVITFHFHSDGSGSDAGFQLLYRAEAALPDCGGVFTNTKGDFHSPSVDGKYPHRIVCEYLIQTKPQTTIKFQFVAFEMEPANSCAFDSVSVYDGPDKESPFIKKFCGLEIPDDVIESTSNFLFVEFKSDNSNSYNGFSATYKEVCRIIYTMNAGTITSSNNGQEQACHYEIIAPEGQYIKLEFTDFNICSAVSCESENHLNIYDGILSTSTRLASHCKLIFNSAEVSPNTIVSKHNRLILEFQIVDPSLCRQIFEVNYTFIDAGKWSNHGCGAILTAANGIIRSPTDNDGGGQYSHNLDCRWIIMAPAGKAIQLTWLELDVEDTGNCRFDYVALFDNSTLHGGQMGKFCGEVVPPAVTSSGNILTIQFITDASHTGAGFAASYKFIEASSVCGGNYFNNFGYIESPNWPNKYEANQTCVWTLTVPAMQQIQLTVHNFTIEKYYTCVFDFLEIRNGGTADSPLIGTYCGTNIPTHINSFSNKMYLKFKSDIMRQSAGFRIEYDGSAVGCGGLTTGFQGVVTSPNYPEPYTVSTVCIWKINVNKGLRIQVVFNEIDFEVSVSGNCYYDYVEFFDGSDISGKTLGRFCNPNSHPLQLESTGNTMTIRMKTDSSESGRGFSIRYQANCNVTLTEYFGVIESPNFPNSYPVNMNCEWKIEAPMGNKIFMEFDTFDLEKHLIWSNADVDIAKKCELDYVQITIEDSITGDVEKYGKFCQAAPESFTTKYNVVRISFITDFAKHGQGFRLEYNIQGCGGNLNGPSGTFSSPNYPQNYPKNTICEWTIGVEYGHIIELTVHSFEFEIGGKNCISDGLIISNTRDFKNDTTAKLCHFETHPTTYVSNGHKMYLQFKSDSSITYKGFNATYTEMAGKCGGEIKSSFGFIYTPNYPSNYPSNIHCEWLITVKPNHLIDLGIMDFYTEMLDHCDMDKFVIYDGNAINDDRELVKYCGSNTRPTGVYSSTGNKMLITFDTDGSGTAKGFKLNYTMACGARIDVTDSGMFQMNSILMSSNNCTWFLRTLDATKHITLSFSKIIGLTGTEYNRKTNTSECYERIQVYDGDTLESPLVREICKEDYNFKTITSSGQFLTVNFYSFYFYYGAKLQFTAIYSTLDNACGGDINAIKGIIASPNYPNSYPMGIECVWNIRASPGNKLNLMFLDMDIISSDACNEEDYLEVREKDASGKVLGLFCGNTLPTDVLTGAGFWIKFRSGNVGTAKGFELQFSYLQENEISGESGVITSPLYPDSNFQENGRDSEQISWRILVKDTSVVTIHIKELNILNYGTCETALKIYNGYDETAAQLSDEICDLNITNPLITTSNVAFIRINFNHQLRSSMRLRLEWKEIPKPELISIPEYDEKCGNGSKVILLTNYSTISISSPGYPDGYDHYLNCSWLISTNLTIFHPVMYFMDLSLEGTEDACTTDYVAVSKSSDLLDWESYGRYCASPPGRLFAGYPYLKINFITDYYTNKTGFKINFRVVCGSNLTGPSGEIDFESHWRLGTTCIWKVTVKPGRTIQFKFEEIDMDCLTEMIIKNGIDDASPILGGKRYCGNSSEIPEIPATSSNRAIIKLTLGLHNTKFRLKYQEISFDCSEQIVLPHKNSSTIIMTPNYPNIPDPYSECSWVVSSASGENLKIEFLDRFDIKQSPNCESEYVEIRSGSTKASQVVAKHCDRHKPYSEIIQNNLVQVRYYTAMAEPNNGFKMKISVAPCGKVFRNTDGVITSPMHDEETYPNGIECFYHIIGRAGSTINLSLKQISLPYDDDCKLTDHIAIYSYSPIADQSGKQNGTELLGTYCGEITEIEDIAIPENEVIIRFVSQNKNEGDSEGFKIIYNTTRQICKSEYNGERGHITSPGYPNASQIRQICQFQITVPEGRRVKINFDDFDLYNDFENRNQIFFSHGSDSFISIDTLNARNSTSQLQSIYSSSNKMHISHHNFVPSQHRGFELQFSSDEPTICAGSLNEMSGGMSIPANETSFLCEYYRSGDAYWAESPNVGTMALEIEEFNVTLFCIYEGISVSFSSSAEDWSNEICVTSPRYFKILIPTTHIRIIAKKSNGLMGNGVVFSAKYKVHKCGGTILMDSAQCIIHLPNMTDSNYGKIDCAWQVKAGPNEYILFNLTQAIFKSTQNAEYIRVYQGASSAHPNIATYHTNQLDQRQILSHRNQLFIEYHADAYNPASEIEIKLEASSRLCGGILTNHMKHLSSPRVNANSTQYPNNAECIWEIHALPGYHIGLQFHNRFQIQSSTNCTNDYVEVFNWVNYEWESLDKLCGRDMPKPINSTGTRMKVVFRTDGAITGDGFNATWHEHCGGVFEASASLNTIVSPNYPESFPNNQYCRYNLTAPTGKYIKIHFNDFDFADITFNCRYVNFTIYKVPDYAANAHDRELVGVYCKHRVPKDRHYLSAVDFIFQSNTWLESRGFNIEFILDDCGGRVLQSQEIRSPRAEHSNNYTRRDDCVWNITAPEGQKITIQFDYIFIEQGLYCYYDYIEIFSGPQQINKNRLAKLCGNHTESAPKITIPENKALVRFKSDRSNEQRGFHAFIIFSEACDEKIVLNDSQPMYRLNHSKNAANPKAMDCQYTIKSSADTTIELKFTKFHVAVCDATLNRTNNCSCDSVEVRDGIFSIDAFMGRFCGHTLPPTIFTSSNGMWLRYITEGGVSESQGFEAELRMKTSVCGRRLYTVADNSVILESPNDGTNYLPNINCAWTIEANDSSKYIEVIFEKFDVQDVGDTEECSYDRMELNEEKGVIGEGLGEDLIVNGDHATYANHQHFLISILPQLNTIYYCGSKLPSHFVSLGHKLHIKFVTDSDIEQTGFKLKIRSFNACRNYTSTQGKISNLDAQYCEFYIQAPVNYTITIYFLDLRFADNNCTVNGIKIFENNANGKILGNFCGFTLPDPVFSSTNVIYLEFKKKIRNDDSYVAGKMDLYYLATDQGPGCGGELFNYGGVFSSPNYPLNDRSNSDCRWNIRVPNNMRVGLRFSMFVMGTNNTCETNFVEIIEVNTEGVDRVARTYCGDQKPAAYKGERNVLSVRHKKTVNFGGTGFLAEFMQVFPDAELQNY